MPKARARLAPTTSMTIAPTSDEDDLRLDHRRRARRRAAALGTERERRAERPPRAAAAPSHRRSRAADGWRARPRSVATARCSGGPRAAARPARRAVDAAIRSERTAAAARAASSDAAGHEQHRSAFQRQALGDLLLQAADETVVVSLRRSRRRGTRPPLGVGERLQAGANPADVGRLDVGEERVVPAAPIELHPAVDDAGDERRLLRRPRCRRAARRSRRFGRRCGPDRARRTSCFAPSNGSARS